MFNSNKKPSKDESADDKVTTNVSKESKEDAAAKTLVGLAGGHVHEKIFEDAAADKKKRLFLKKKMVNLKRMELGSGTKNLKIERIILVIMILQHPKINQKKEPRLLKKKKKKEHFFLKNHPK